MRNLRVLSLFMEWDDASCFRYAQAISTLPLINSWAKCWRNHVLLGQSINGALARSFLDHYRKLGVEHLFAWI